MSTDAESTEMFPPGGSPDLRPRPWAAQLRPSLFLIGLGVLLALGWRLLAPYTAELGDDQEAAAAVDGTLALLGVLFGVGTASFVLIRPGRFPVARTVAVILASVIGGLISWQLGDQLGTPALRAVGAAFTWPVATCAGLFLGALLPWTSGRLQPPPPVNGVPLGGPPLGGYPPGGYPSGGQN